MLPVAPPAPPLTLANALPVLRAYVEELRFWQIPGGDGPDAGSLVNPAYGLPDPGASGSFVTACAYLTLASSGQADGPLLAQAVAAAEALLCAQRPGGLVDLLSVNYDSSPDTGFLVQQLCPVLELGRARSFPDSNWAALLARVEQFVLRAVPGMVDGGFHTPNHRWVIASALAQARSLFPDLEVAATVAAYLAEGFDLDPEGAFLERSVGVYDAVTDRSLLFLAEHWDCPQALDAVERNLAFNLHLLHADGSGETGLSRRQDYGTREVLLGLAPCYLLCHRARPNPVFAQAAQTLWRQSPAPANGILWLCHALLQGGDPEPVTASLPEDFARYYPHNGLWRVRRGLLSASFFAHTTRLLSLTFGRAELTSLKISQTYFGQYTGRFVGDGMDVQEGRLTLRSEGRANPRRPGYELPLGRPVLPERWQAMLPERGLRRLPPATSELSAQEVEGGFDLRYRTLDGLDRVAAQLAFDFPPGGVWETADTAIRPHAGQVIFLKQGCGTMRYGNDAIRIGPGAHAHTMWEMREAETAPGHVRVLFTFQTPVEHRFEIRVSRGVEREA